MNPLSTPRNHRNGYRSWSAVISLLVIGVFGVVAFREIRKQNAARDAEANLDAWRLQEREESKRQAALRRQIREAMRAEDLALLEKRLDALPTIDGEIVSLLDDPARAGRVDVFTLWFRKYWSRVEPKNPSMLNNALDCAVIFGQEELVRLLLQNGVSVRDRQGKMTPVLCHAAEKKNVAIARMLVDAGADVNAPFLPPANAWTPIYTPEELEAVPPPPPIQHMSRKRDGWTPLMFAAEQGDEAMVRFLISRRADRNYLGKRGESALSLAREKGDPVLVGLLPVR